MGRKFIIVSLTTMVLTGIICSGFCIADNWGSVDYSEIKAKKEAKIKALASMDVQRVFEELQKPSFMSDRKGLKGAIRKSRFNRMKGSQAKENHFIFPKWYLPPFHTNQLRP
jgi:hypothetical protein